MIELREIADTFLYFRLFLVILAVVPYLVVVKRTTPFWLKQTLGAEILVVLLTGFNLVLLFRQFGWGVIWDVLNLVLAGTLFYKTRKLETRGQEKGMSFLSIFWSVNFWFLALLYLIIFPLGFAPLR